MMEIEVKRKMEYMKLHPLPLRMPKYAEVSSISGSTFVDDVWDGTGEYNAPSNADVLLNIVSFRSG